MPQPIKKKAIDIHARLRRLQERRDPLGIELKKKTPVKPKVAKKPFVRRKFVVVCERPSDGARALAGAIGALKIKPNKLPQNLARVVVNWGDQTVADRRLILNKVEAVRRASNKLSTFLTLKENGISVPEFTRDKTEATRWGGTVLERHTLTGSGGAGIVVKRLPAQQLGLSPLYVKYIPKEYEYRLHILRNKVVFVQQKRAKGDFEQTADQKLIRNHDNGWVFCENNVQFPSRQIDDAVRDLSIRAVAALGLDFGAVDIIVSKATRAAGPSVPFVLEVNTAPGIESTALKEAYAQSFGALEV